MKSEKIEIITQIHLQETSSIPLLSLSDFVDGWSWLLKRIWKRSLLENMEVDLFLYSTSARMKYV